MDRSSNLPLQQPARKDAPGQAAPESRPSRRPYVAPILDVEGTLVATTRDQFTFS